MVSPTEPGVVPRIGAQVVYKTARPNVSERSMLQVVYKTFEPNRVFYAVLNTVYKVEKFDLWSARTRLLYEEED